MKKKIEILFLRKKYVKKMEKFPTEILLDLSSGIYIYISEGKCIMKKKSNF
jgi:hypothetical protein